MTSIVALARDLEAGRTTSVREVERCIDAARTHDAVFLAHFPEALEAARAADRARAAGTAPSRFAGVPISVKALFDVAGHVTTAGSAVLQDAAPAQHDATAVARLRAAGFIPLGHTNMTEFAYSGLGLNPHYGTPKTPLWSDEARIAGGSSSGAAVSVATGGAVAAIGTDTGGSCRIPAAFCGLVGSKPTARRIPQDGVVPLSPSLDSVGSLARTVGCCAILDAVMAGEAADPPQAADIDGITIGVVEDYVMADAEPRIADAHARTLARLEAAGARLMEAPFARLNAIADASANGGLVAFEAYGIHRDRLAAGSDRYDPRVLTRIMKGATLSEGDVSAFRDLRRALADDLARLLSVCDVLVYPTTPILPPRLSALDDDAAYNRANLLCLRNPTIANIADACSISLPNGTDRGYGLCLVNSGGQDRQLLAIARGIEGALGAG